MSYTENSLKMQITALNIQIEEGKAKNPYAIKNKIKRLKMALKLETEKHYKIDNLSR